ncbi:ABC transporter ATP-binding protein [Kordiimonas aquimaris]|uniref:ABC transporter ATP-binding protein n=1 Tax=Kordiimonas aquimaris TaxID=707591 RepID=UPI00374CFCC5
MHLSDVSATFDIGSFNVLLGPTASGKTTLMRIMAGLDVPTSGSIVINGSDLTGIPVRKRSVAFVYQQFINYPGMTVFDNIASPLKVAGVSRSDIAARVEKIASLMGLMPMLSRKPLELSGGQQQRVALARALVREAELVLLDEPLANLDYKLREELRAELPKLFKETGSIVVYATTEPEEALMLGGQTILLHEGRLLQVGTTPEVYRTPRTIQAAQTFSDPPLNTAWVKRSGFVSKIDDIDTTYESADVLADGTYQIGFRAHHLMLQKPHDNALKIKAVVVTTEITGSETFLHINASGLQWTALVHGVHHYSAGDSVSVYVDPRNFLTFDASGEACMIEAA